MSRTELSVILHSQHLCSHRSLLLYPFPTGRDFSVLGYIYRHNSSLGHLLLWFDIMSAQPNNQIRFPSHLPQHAHNKHTYTHKYSQNIHTNTHTQTYKTQTHTETHNTHTKHKLTLTQTHNSHTHKHKFTHANTHIHKHTKHTKHKHAQTRTHTHENLYSRFLSQFSQTPLV